MNLNDMRVVRTIEVRGVATGIDATASSLGRLSDAQDKVASSADAMAVTTETSARRQTSVAGSYDRLRRQIDDAYGATTRFQRAQATLDRAHAQGITTVDEHSRMLDMARAKYLGATGANDNLTKSISLQRHEWINLGRQANDAITMLASGSSAFQVLATQGGQVVDVFTASQAGFTGFLRSIGPVGLAVGAVAVSLGAALKVAYDFAHGQDEVERSLNGVGRMSGATVAGINQVAMQTADAARVSVASARSMSSSFAATGRIGQDLYGDLTMAASRYARTTGMDVTDATEKLAAAFADPVRGASDLNKALGFLSGRTSELIDRQVAMGDKAGAQRTLLEAMKTSLIGVAEQTNAWALAWDAVARAAKNAYDATGRSVMSVIAPSLDQQLAAKMAQYEGAQRAVGQLGNANRGDSEHERYLRSVPGMTEDMIRRELTPGGPGSAGDQALDDARRKVDQLRHQIEDIQERIRRASAAATAATRQTDVNDITTRAKGIIEQITPTTADILRLTGFQTALDKALGTGQAPSGTKEALERIRQLLRDGGTEAHNLAGAARDAFSLAGLLPYQRGLAQIETTYRHLFEKATDPQVIAGLGRAKSIEISAFNVQNQDNVVRDARMRIVELVAGLQVQKDSLLASSEAAATMAAKQDLVNEAIRNGQDPAERYKGKLDELAAAMGKVKGAEEDFNRVKQNIVGGMDEIRSGSRGLLTGVFSDLRQRKNPLQSLTVSVGAMSGNFFPPDNDAGWDRRASA